MTSDQLLDLLKQLDPEQGDELERLSVAVRNQSRELIRTLIRAWAGSDEKLSANARAVLAQCEAAARPATRRARRPGRGRPSMAGAHRGRGGDAAPGKDGASTRAGLRRPYGRADAAAAGRRRGAADAAPRLRRDLSPAATHAQSAGAPARLHHELAGLPGARREGARPGRSRTRASGACGPSWWRTSRNDAEEAPRMTVEPKGRTSIRHAHPDQRAGLDVLPPFASAAGDFELDDLRSAARALRRLPDEPCMMAALRAALADPPESMPCRASSPVSWRSGRRSTCWWAIWSRSSPHPPRARRARPRPSRARWLGKSSCPTSPRRHRGAPRDGSRSSWWMTRRALRRRVLPPRAARWLHAPGRGSTAKAKLASRTSPKASARVFFPDLDATESSGTASSSSTAPSPRRARRRRLPWGRAAAEPEAAGSDGASDSAGAQREGAATKEDAACFFEMALPVIPAIDEGEEYPPSSGDGDAALERWIRARGQGVGRHTRGGLLPLPFRRASRRSGTTTTSRRPHLGRRENHTVRRRKDRPLSWRHPTSLGRAHRCSLR